MHAQEASSLQVLEFLLAAGVDIAIGDEPVNRLQPPASIGSGAASASAVGSANPGHGADPSPGRPDPRMPPSTRSGMPAGERITSAPGVFTAPEDAAMAARALAQSAPDLETLERLLEAFDGCALKSTASRLVFADGNPKAKIMIVGEAPGRDEDEIGKPFVGRAGQLLDRMLAAIRLTRSDVYIANVVPWRPPGNRTPTPQEIAICMPFLARQIALCDPDILFTLGAPASQHLLNQKDGILRLRGRWFEYRAGARAIAALASLHPAYLLRQPAQKALAWRDLRSLRAKLDAMT